MKNALKLVAVLVLFVGVTYVVPFDQAEDFLTANFFSTEAERVSLTEPTLAKEVVPVKKDMFENGMNEFVLKADQKGTENYIIPQNTCRNGVRVIVRSVLEAGNMSADIHVFGYAPKQSRETYNKVVTVTKDEDQVKILHLPSELLHNNDTLFPEYQITRSRNSEMLRYDVMCY